MTRIIAALIRPLTWALGLLAVWWQGGRAAKAKARQEALTEAVARLQTREAIEDAIQNDTGLVQRLRDAGGLRDK